ncbi:MAG: hypothetical protein ACYDC9_07345 [Dermatophilaceae bacterium]
MGGGGLRQPLVVGHQHVGVGGGVGDVGWQSRHERFGLDFGEDPLEQSTAVDALLLT